MCYQKQVTTELTAKERRFRCRTSRSGYRIAPYVRSQSAQSAGKRGTIDMHNLLKKIVGKTCLPP
jgi:hypothetical protein